MRLSIKTDTKKKKEQIIMKLKLAAVLFFLFFKYCISFSPQQMFYSCYTNGGSFSCACD